MGMEATEVFSRRNFMAAAGGSVVAAFANASSAAADGSNHTFWMLNPSWGTPLTTAMGSDTKSECHGAACHNAAPHRFFLTRADAIAGRLQIGCLAQPEAVTVCVDLNVVMPYYNARLGGVDGRCPVLPASLRTALHDATACSVVAPAPPPATPPPAVVPPELPRTGEDGSSILAAAAATTALGVVVWAATSRDKTVKS